ncbi:MAG: hypothetical protein QW666_03160 [Candidatus Woesearchaeota archaeon]
MSEDNKKMVRIRTATEESICAVLAEACYVCGGTPEEFKKIIESDPYLSAIYHKEPYFFKGRCQEKNAPFLESVDIYY